MEKMNAYHEWTPSVPPQHLTDRALAEYAERALIYPGPALSADVYYLKHVSDCYDRPECRTLLFFTDGKVIGSPETATKLLHDYLSDRGTSYDWCRTLGASVGVSEKVPAVLGHLCWAPTSGPSRQETDWIAMHHLLDAEALADHSGTILAFANYHTAEVSLSRRQVGTMIENSRKLAAADVRLMQDYLAHYRTTTGVRQTGSVLDRASTLLDGTASAPTYARTATELADRLAKKRLAEHYGADWIEEFGGM